MFTVTITFHPDIQQYRVLFLTDAQSRGVAYFPSIRAAVVTAAIARWCKSGLLPIGSDRG